MTTVSNIQFHVGYQSRWTQQHPAEVVNRLKLTLRDRIREIFDQELMDSWDSPLERSGPHQGHDLKDALLTRGEDAFVRSLSALTHPEHESEAALPFVQDKLSEVNEKHDRSLSAETGDAQVIEGCLYVDHIWKKVESFAIYENGEPLAVEAHDAATGAHVRVPLLAAVMYECVLPEPG